MSVDERKAFHRMVVLQEAEVEKFRTTIQGQREQMEQAGVTLFGTTSHLGDAVRTG